MPVNTVSLRLGISTLKSLRLFSRAPCTRITSWLSARCCLEEVMFSAVDRGRRPDALRTTPLGEIRQREQIQAREHERQQRQERQETQPLGIELPNQRDAVGDDDDRQDDGRPPASRAEP